MKKIRDNMFIKKWTNLSAPRKLMFGFLTAIIIGSILLKMPFSLEQGVKISFLEALFTVVSAVCVTGLSVLDVSQTFSPFGDGIIIFFIQLGGLGVMTFSLMIFVILGKKMSFETRELLKEERNSENNGGVLKFIRVLILTIFIIEAVGALILAYAFKKYMPYEKALYYGIFHSISAFCNAGFSLFSDNLERFKNDSLINLTISYLIILGGMGFSVISSFIVLIRRGQNRFNLTSKLSLMMGFSLTFLGMLLFLLFEYNNSLTIGNMNFLEKLMASFFQSVTLRTAGFNTINLSGLRSVTIFISYIFMFIGASPGSTGGGVKTTTFAILIFYVAGIIRRKEYIEVFNRRLDWEIMNKALTILVISLFYISLVVIVILAIEPISVEKVIYEVISAFATVGLSMKVTPTLGTVSRILIIFTMFVGRLGPMTIAFAFTDTKKKVSFKYPKEDILVG